MDKGKGKAKEKATKLPRAKIYSKGKKKPVAVFDCPFCKETASVTCTVSEEWRKAEVLCEKCKESYWGNILPKDPTPQPIDIYNEWITELKWIKNYNARVDEWSKD